MAEQAPVALVVVIQMLLATTFIVVPVIALRFGDAAQKAAETYAERNGVASSLLLKNGFNIRESRVAMLFPLTLAGMFAVLATLNLMGNPAGRLASLIVHSVFFFVGGVITAGQVFVAQYTERMFARSGNAALQHLNARELVAAGNAAFPAWLRPLIVIRFFLATGGSAIVVAALLFSR